MLQARSPRALPPPIAPVRSAAHSGFFVRAGICLVVLTLGGCGSGTASQPATPSKPTVARAARCQPASPRVVALINRGMKHGLSSRPRISSADLVPSRGDLPQPYRPVVGGLYIAAGHIEGGRPRDPIIAVWALDGQATRTGAGFIQPIGTLSLASSDQGSPDGRSLYLDPHLDGYTRAINCERKTVARNLLAQRHRATPRPPTTHPTAPTAPQPAPSARAQTQPPPSPPPAANPPSPSNPAGFCATHTCIPNFPNGHGSIVQCADGEYSHSGGRPGACSRHGGEK